MEFRYIILGAGLAGLGSAYHLEENGMKDWFILEKNERVGGLCRSENYDGFTFDHSIHILYTKDPYAKALIKKLLGDNVTIQERSSWVYTYGVYTLYPWQANFFGLPVEIIKECLLGLIQATCEKNKVPPPKNFEEWCYYTFGNGIARHFMIPYNKKLWAIDLKKMTDAWIKDRVLTPSLEEAIEGALTDRMRRFGPNAVFWYPREGGIEALPKGFLRYLDEEKIMLNSEVVGIDWKEKKVFLKDGRNYNYEKLIYTLPLPKLEELMRPPLPAQVLAAVRRLEYNTVHTVDIAVKRRNISDKHWVYFPEEKYLMHRISFPMNFSPSMAPEGWSSIQVEVSESKYKRIPKGQQLIERVVSDLREARIIREDDHIEVKSVLTLSPAYIIYTHTHRDDVKTIHSFLKSVDIFPAGRFANWEYLNMDQSIQTGKKAAMAILGIRESGADDN